MTIHREGRALLFILLLITVAGIWALDYFFQQQPVLRNSGIGLLIVFYLLVLQFFRNPSVRVEKNPKHILAPADGKVVVVEEADEPEYLRDRRKQISIFMSPVNVHVNRMPVGGTISYCTYHPGKYLVAWHPKSSTENERTTVAVKTDEGVEILFRQIAGALARRIKCYVQKGQRLEQGDEFGFIKFGSRVDVFVPLHAEVLVKPGDKTTAGKTVIARLT
ncbi:MAG: phosphatidylserine decarboxylase family protein [Cyclobacteriaceae bacterium]|nr:phosphatidylserine decarboxylase family protein [Cyclobacteriaceae bacterium]MCX7636631.1 phosphatidylserine decarboxylase family protein [Cyclobacteriaceae bacterium]MDW8331865.1 phosphatidylserine decarboxylase family protein [Cyclobacteriaceae bacterium]